MTRGALCRPISLGAAFIAGAAAVGLVVVFGGWGDSASALEHDPGIPPPDYAFLDSSRVVLYLGQLEGGLSKSETVTAQATQNRNAGVSASGFSIGGSTERSSRVEQTVTPTDTALFYRLLDRLNALDYLTSIDMRAKPVDLRAAFGRVPEGTFVELRNCTFRIPTYVQLEQATRASHGRGDVADLYLTAGGQSYGALEAGNLAFALAHPEGLHVDVPLILLQPGTRRPLRKALNGLVTTTGTNPRVPVSTCNGKPVLRPRGVDILFPVQLRDLSPEQSLFAGRLTVVGKLIRAVRTPSNRYVDEASLARFHSSVSAVDEASGVASYGLSDELASDVTVLSPGYVILPIAIYK